MEDTNPFKEKEEIKQDIPVDSSPSKAEEELSALAITTEKYKPIVINGVSIPSVVRTDAPDKPYIVTEPRTVADLILISFLMLQVSLFLLLVVINLYSIKLF